MVGVILCVYAAIPAFISIHVGKWIDKIGVQLPVTISICMITCACLIPIFLPFESFGIWPVLLVSLLAGTGFVFTLISGQGLVGQLSSNKTRATAFTYQSIAFSLSGSTGPVVAGYLIDHASYYAAYGGAACFAAVGALLFFAQAKGLPQSLSQKKASKEKSHSSFELFKFKGVREILIASALVSMAWDLQAFMIPVYGTEIGLDAVAIGWLLSTFSICTFAVRVLMPVLSNLFKEWTIILFVLFSTGITYLVFPFVTSIFLLFVLCGWLGANLGASQPNVLSLLHQVTPEGRIGEAIGIRTMLMNSSHAALPLLFGFGGTAVGASAAFWTIGSIMLGGGSGIWYSVKKTFSKRENAYEDKAIERAEQEEFEKK